MRSEDKARQLQDQFGVTAVVGSFADTDKLAELAAEADVVFATMRLVREGDTQSLTSGAPFAARPIATIFPRRKRSSPA